MKRYVSFIESKHNENPSHSMMFCCRYSTITVMIRYCFCYVFLSWPNLLYLTLLVSMRELPVCKIYKIRVCTEITDTVQARLRTRGLINLINTDYVMKF